MNSENLTKMQQFINKKTAICKYTVFANIQFMQKLLKFIFLITDQLKNDYIGIINIVIIIKKGSGGNYLMLLGDFALEPSENFNSIFLKIEFADSIDFKQV